MADAANGNGGLTEAVLQSASETAKTVQALEQGVETLERSAENQQARIAEILKTVEQGVEALSSFTRNTASVTETIASVADSAQRGQGQVSLLVKDVGVMAQQAASSDSFLTELAKTMERIVAMADEIKDVAEGLSVIAINTAIEAARAGDRGRGFNVISREIRVLAERSGTLSDGIGRSVKDASLKLSGVRDLVSASGASSRSASQTTKAFSGEFTSIVEGAALANEQVSSFKHVANERLEAERAIADQVRAIASESSFIVRNTEASAELASRLRGAIERSLAAIGSERSDRHVRALAEAEALGQHIPLDSLGAQKSIDARLFAAFTDSAAFELLYVMDAAGRQISSNAVNPRCRGKISSTGYGVIRADRDYFAMPMKTGRSWVSSAYLSSASGSLCITASVPLKDASGRIVAVLAADLDAAGLSACED